jgi:hypothetical protein
VPLYQIPKEVGVDRLPWLVSLVTGRLTLARCGNAPQVRAENSNLDRTTPYSRENTLGHCQTPVCERLQWTAMTSKVHILTPRRLPGHNVDQAPSQGIDTYCRPTIPS